MRSGLLIPTERPPTDIDIKRALLTLDQVQLLAPSDRELIPPEHFASASANLVGAPSMPVFSSNGPVLPLGKISNYDETFAKTLEECKEADREGLLILREAPAGNAGMSFFGTPPSPKDWENPTNVLGIFKALGSDAEVLATALEGVAGPEMMRRMDLAALVPISSETTMDLAVGARQFSVPMNTAVATLTLPNVPSDLVQPYTRLAAARLGSVVKALGICHHAGLHPVSVDPGVNSLISFVQNKSASVLQSALTAENDPEALQLALRVERLLFEQMLPDEVIGALSFQDILRLRSKAWGATGEHKVRLLQTVRELASDAKDLAEFDHRVSKEIAAYQKANQTFDDELKKKGLRAGGWVVSGGAASAAKTLIEQALGLGSWQVALLLGAGVAISNLAPDAITLYRRLAELRGSAGKVLLRTYDTLGIK